LGENVFFNSVIKQSGGGNVYYHYTS